MKRAALALAFVGLGACKQTVTDVVPQLQPPQASYDAGAVPVLNESLVEIPVMSVGRAPLHVSNVMMTAGQGPFTLKSFPTEAIDTDNTVPIVVSFVPPAEMAYTSTVTFDTDDTDNAHVTVNL